MAIISIPTSISGLNIPGSIFGGPLSDLYDDGGSFYYQYPRDLGSSTKAHSVEFSFLEVQEMTMEDLQGFAQDAVDIVGNQIDEFTGSFGEGSANEWWNSLTTSLNGFAEETNKFLDGGFKNAASSIVGGIFKSANMLAGGYEYLGEKMSEPRVNQVGVVGLYMPENFSLSTSVDYDSNSTLAAAMGALPILGSVIKAGTNVAEGGGNDAMKLMLNRAGYVFNPNRQILFQGVEFRDFEMAFTFTPYSAGEQQQVKNIIEKFRMYASPKKNTQIGTNMFWVPPALFEIKFKQGGQENENLPKLKRCVIESVDVNYTPNGWTTFADGAPVQTTMNIKFKEIALIGRDDIKEGY
jgi:hypothetical protein